MIWLVLSGREVVGIETSRSRAYDTARYINAPTKVVKEDEWLR